MLGSIKAVDPGCLLIVLRAMYSAAIFNFRLLFSPHILCPVELITLNKSAQATISTVLIYSTCAFIYDISLILLVLSVLLWTSENSHLLYLLVTLNLASLAIIILVACWVILTFVLLLTIASLVILLWIIVSIYTDSNRFFV